MSEVRSPKSERQIIRWIIFFVIVTRLAVAFRSEEKIYTRPYSEDSFYLFNCAEHFAHGEGFTCDGKSPTNGVQPLIVIIYTPLFLVAGADKLLALRLGFILTALFDSLSIVFIAKLVRILQKKPDEEIRAWKSPPVIAAFLWATLYPIFVHSGAGMETGIYSVLLLSILYYYAKLSRLRSEGNAVSNMHWLGFGVLLGFTVLARIDAVILVVSIASFEIYKWKRKGLISATIISFFAFIISSPWWWYNYHIFGSIMPQSGVAEALQKGMLAENLRRAAIVIGDIGTVFFFLPNYELPEWFHYFWMLAIILIVLWIVKTFALKNYLKENYILAQLTPYYLFCGILAIYYIFFFSSPHFIPRYFHPFRIIWLVLFSCVAPKIISGLKDFYSRKRNLTLGFIWVFSLAALGFSASSYAYYFLIKGSSDFYKTGQFALMHPLEKIGMWQSGTAGFIAPNVVNLDGKVNNAALQANLKGEIGRYIADEKLDYLADWREFAMPAIISASKYGMHFSEVDSIGRIKIFKSIK